MHLSKLQSELHCLSMGRHSTQQNGILRNDTQCNDVQHLGLNNGTVHLQVI